MEINMRDSRIKAEAQGRCKKNNNNNKEIKLLCLGS